MEWYWWVLIVVGLVGVIILKVKVGSMWIKKQMQKKARQERSAEDEV